MQSIKMNAAELRQYLLTSIGKAMSLPKPLDLPLRVPVAGDPEGNWKVDLSKTDLYGYDDLIAVVIDAARSAIALKVD